MKQYKIALLGNPNSGKTTLFNALTGSNQYVGNWPGVTVEKKEGKYLHDKNVTVTDLPGIYSLSPYTLEEVISRNYLLEEKPDVILNIVDGTNLERNLYLTTQLLELGIPVLVCINMMDAVRKNGDIIHVDKLSAALGIPVLTISALRLEGIEEAAHAALTLAKSGEYHPKSAFFSGVVEHALAHIEEALLHEMPQEKQRFYSVKLFERDEKVLSEFSEQTEKLSHIEGDIRAAEELLDDDAEAIVTNERYLYIARILEGVYVKKNAGKLSFSERVDLVLTNRILALPIFALLMFLVYYLSLGSVGNWTVEFMNETLFGTWIIPGVTAFLEGIGVQSWLVSLVADGILGGVGSVLGFVPQMLILFLLLSILEDCGYMARVAFIMDRLFRKFGLSGKSFIPLLVATGCGVPGIMASRTIEQERDRRMTVMTTTFMPCGAKMPIVAMVAGALFENSAWVATSAYFLGVGAVIVSGLILKKTKPFRGKPAPFVMELPAYHAPVASNILRTTLERGVSFVKRAGSVVVAASVFLWVLNSLSFEGGFHYITEEHGGASVLQILGGIVAPLFAPLGFGNWQSAVATVLGLVAKEEVVGAFGTLASMTNASLAAGSEGALFAAISEQFFASNPLSAFSFMAFNLLCAPCFAAMGAIRREMNDWRWTAFAITYMCAFAYAVSLMIFQFGSLFAGQANPVGVVFAALTLFCIVYLLFRRVKRA